MRQRGFTAIEALIVLAIVGIFAAAIFVPVYTCPLKWADSGLRAEWRWFAGGCMVQRKDGTWIPEKAIRDVSL